MIRVASGDSVLLRQSGLVALTEAHLRDIHALHSRHLAAGYVRSFGLSERPLAHFFRLLLVQTLERTGSFG